MSLVGFKKESCLAGAPKQKKDKIVECIHAARVAWGIDGRKLSLFSEDEGVTQCSEVQRYLLNKGGSWHIPQQEGALKETKLRAQTGIFCPTFFRMYRCGD